MAVRVEPIGAESGILQPICCTLPYKEAQRPKDINYTVTGYTVVPVSRYFIRAAV